MTFIRLLLVVKMYRSDIVLEKSVLMNERVSAISHGMPLRSPHWARALAAELCPPPMSHESIRVFISVVFLDKSRKNTASVVDVYF